MTIDCPYCGKSQQYTGDPLGDGDEAEDECQCCGKKFNDYRIGIGDSGNRGVRAMTWQQALHWANVAVRCAEN